MIAAKKGGLNMKKISKAMVGVKHFWKETFKSRILAICFGIIFLISSLQNVKATMIGLAIIMLCTFALALYRDMNDYTLQCLRNEGRTYKAFMICYTILMIMTALKIFGIFYWITVILALMILWFDIDPKKVWELIKNKIHKK